MPEKNESQKSFQIRTFAPKALNVLTQSEKVAGSKTATEAEKARAKKAGAAATRVLNRLINPSSGKKGSRTDKPKAQAAPKTPKTKGSPAGGIRDLLPGKFRGPANEALGGRKAAEREKVR